MYHTRFRVRRIAAQGVLGVVVAYSAFAGGIRTVDRKWWADHVEFALPVIDFVQNTHPVCLVLFPPAIVGLGLLAESFRPKRIDRAIKRVLNQFREEFAAGNDELDYRVTLFRHQKFCFRLVWQWKPPWSGALVPYERSGEYRLKPTTVLHAPRTAPDFAQGYAGLIFRSWLEQSVVDLPEISKESGPAALKDYAGATNINLDWIRHRIRRGYRFPRAFWGIPVEINGVWGVLLIDSRKPSIPKKEQLRHLVRPYLICLKSLLEE